MNKHLKDVLLTIVFIIFIGPLFVFCMILEIPKLLYFVYSNIILNNNEEVELKIASKIISWFLKLVT